MEITPVMTVAELQDLTLNDELLSICSSDNLKAVKIISQVSARLWNKIDKEIFFDEDMNTYNIPTDLKVVCASLCESYYTYFVKEGMNSAARKKLSEKIDDYSITYSDSSSAYTFFWIPTDSDVIAMIEAYSGMTGKGYWLVNLH